MRNSVNGCLGPSEIVDSDDDNSELGDIQAPLSVATGVFVYMCLFLVDARVQAMMRHAAVKVYQPVDVMASCVCCENGTFSSDDKTAGSNAGDEAQKAAACAVGDAALHRGQVGQA